MTNVNEPCSSLAGLPLPALQEVASTFKVLAEPMRLQLLETLRHGEQNLGTLSQRCGCSPANVSRHLEQLVRLGFVSRERRGASAYFRIADPSVYALCDLVCGRLARHLEREARAGALFSSSAQPPNPQEPR